MGTRSNVDAYLGHTRGIVGAQGIVGAYFGHSWGKFFTRNTTKIPAKIPTKQAIPAGTGLGQNRQIPAGIPALPRSRSGSVYIDNWCEYNFTKFAKIDKD